MTSPIAINFQENDGIFLSWKAKVAQKLLPGSPILVFKVNGSNRTLKASQVGTVVELAALKDGDVLQKGCLLLRMNGCEHMYVMKDMCADCGENLRVKDGAPGERVTKLDACVAMVHSVPELIVTIDEAKKLGAADESNVLAQRKLVLLVDLDQTLIHTTNEDVDPNLKDVYHFQLYGRNSPWYHVRFRPNTQKFLDALRSMYEMHICTFGARMYAHKIAELLDPDHTIFGHRILSRDECFDSEKKTANLKALFPCGDRLVCIIDDREDVWNFESNVIAVKPYRYFKNTGDINAPIGFTKTERNTDKHYRFTHPSATNDKNSNDNKSDQKKRKKTKRVVVEETEDEKVIAEIEVDSEDDSDNENDTDKDTFKKVDISDKDNDDLNNKNDASFSDDDDDYLHYLEEILRRIHTAFYQLYEQSPKSEPPPDLHSVIPYVKLKILKSVNLVFSAVIPTNVKPEDTLIYNLAKNFGATIQENIVDDLTANQPLTTHLVAGKLGTNKVKLAQTFKNVKIVSPQWLWCCAERWERVDERLFQLNKDDDYTKVYCNLEGNVYKQAMKRLKAEINVDKDVSLKTENIPVISGESVLGKRKPEDLLNDDEFLAKRAAIEEENALANMEKPDEPLVELKDEKKDNSDEDSSDSESVEESLGSVDDEMAAALEREISTDMDPNEIRDA